MDMSTNETTTEAPVSIIGFGAAGFNTAIALRTSGYTGPIRMFSDIDTLPYSPILTSYYAAGELDYEECFPWSQAEIDELDLDIVHEGPVTKLDTKGHRVHTAQGDYPYSKCVIASGSVPTPVGFPRDCGYEPIMLRTMDDAERLKDAITNPGCRRMLASGTSMVSLKTVEACLNRGVEVTLVGIMDHVLDMNALSQAAERFERGLAAQGVTLKLANPIKAVEVIADDGHPLGRRLEVTFANGDVESFDEIFVAHGMRNNLEFVEEGSLALDRGVLVDEFMRSSDPDVYAAGDVVQATELISGDKRIVGIWKNAALQGACAGKAIAAELADKTPTSAFAASLAMNTITVRDTLFISAGTIQLTDSSRVETEVGDTMTVVRIFEDDGDASRLVGFNITCDVDEPGGDAYDLGAMLTMRIREDCARAGK